MRLLERRTQALSRDVRVPLGRREARVTQDFLDAAQVGPALQQVRRRRVTQGVRRDVVDPGERGDLVRDRAYLALVDPTAATSQQQRSAGQISRACGTSPVEPLPYRVGSRHTERHDALLVA